MEITELKHLTTCIDSSNSNRCIDGKHHLFVFSLNTINAVFEVFYKNEDTPYKVKQVTGVSRRVTYDEFYRLNAACRIRLNQEVNNNLSKVLSYVKIAKIVADEVQCNSFEEFLAVAVKLHASTNENDAHYHLSDMLLWDMGLVETGDDEIEVIIDNIIRKVRSKDRLLEGNKYLTQQS